jgi:hypothetical protein
MHDLVEKFRVGNREYRVYRFDQELNLWEVVYQPINAKTGKPWQALRSVRPEGAQIVWLYSNWNTKAREVRTASPNYDDLFEGKRWTGVMGCFPSREAAVDAIRLL